MNALFDWWPWLTRRERECCHMNAAWSGLRAFRFGSRLGDWRREFRSIERSEHCTECPALKAVVPSKREVDINEKAIELLPCPFCGSEARVLTARVSEDCEEARVECTSCAAAGPADEDAHANHAAAASYWNRRPALPPLRAREEAIEAATEAVATKWGDGCVYWPSRRCKQMCLTPPDPGCTCESIATLIADAILSLPAGQATAADMQAFSASEAYCYLWPEDTDEHKALRAAYIKGAASVSTAGQEWRDISSAPQDGRDLWLWKPDWPKALVGGWIKKSATNNGRALWMLYGGHVVEPTHWQPYHRPAPPVAEPIVADPESDCLCGRDTEPCPGPDGKPLCAMPIVAEQRPAGRRGGGAIAGSMDYRTE